ncbi:hypothetical protein Zmor_001484 [Zophobas morio]|uniref:Uncharacterized protein n=1 Tax=Zophobas morio TaxID=2755281 RepID=A0AA38J5C9_9CUCU|nr:hypothetical protein Zmor_001484 [Zophobas morio]
MCFWYHNRGLPHLEIYLTTHYSTDKGHGIVVEDSARKAHIGCVILQNNAFSQWFWYLFVVTTVGLLVTLPECLKRQHILCTKSLTFNRFLVLATMLSQIVLFVCIFYSANSANLTCYQCDPKSPGSCESPDKNNIATTICTGNVTTTNNTDEMPMTKTIKDMSLNSTEPLFCFYLYFDAGVTEHTGYYRGCSTSEGSVQFCTALRMTVEKREINGKMIDCKTCSNNACNVANLDLEGITSTKITPQGKSFLGDTTNTKGGVIGTTVSRCVMFLTVIVTLCAVYC